MVSLKPLDGTGVRHGRNAPHTLRRIGLRPDSEKERLVHRPDGEDVGGSMSSIFGAIKIIRWLDDAALGMKLCQLIRSVA